MTYELEFDPRALKEWHKLGATVREQFKKKLAEVLKQPRVEANRLRELPDCYKIPNSTLKCDTLYKIKQPVSFL